MSYLWYERNQKRQKPASETGYICDLLTKQESLLCTMTCFQFKHTLSNYLKLQ